MSDFESSFTKNASSVKNKAFSTTPSTRNGQPSPLAPTPPSLP